MFSIFLLSISIKHDTYKYHPIICEEGGSMCEEVWCLVSRASVRGKNCHRINGLIVTKEGRDDRAGFLWWPGTKCPSSPSSINGLPPPPSHHSSPDQHEQSSPPRLPPPHLPPASRPRWWIWPWSRLRWFSNNQIVLRLYLHRAGLQSHHSSDIFYIDEVEVKTNAWKLYSLIDTIYQLKPAFTIWHMYYDMYIYDNLWHLSWFLPLNTQINFYYTILFWQTGEVTWSGLTVIVCHLVTELLSQIDLVHSVTLTMG